MKSQNRLLDNRGSRKFRRICCNICIMNVFDVFFVHCFNIFIIFSVLILKYLRTIIYFRYGQRDDKFVCLQVAQRCRRHHCRRWSSSMSTVAFTGDSDEQKQTSKKQLSYDESGKKHEHYYLSRLRPFASCTLGLQFQIHLSNVSDGVVLNNNLGSPPPPFFPRAFQRNWKALLAVHVNRKRKLNTFNYGWRHFNREEFIRLKY